MFRTEIVYGEIILRLNDPISTPWFFFFYYRIIYIKWKIIAVRFSCKLSILMIIFFLWMPYLVYCEEILENFKDLELNIPKRIVFVVGL